MKKYFKLFEEVVLIPNINGKGALYNLLTGNVYELSVEQTKCLIYLENGGSIEEFCTKYIMSDDYLEDYLQLLIEESLGFFSNKEEFVPKLHHTDKLLKQTSIKVPPTVAKAFIVLENDCHQECDYCDSKYLRQYGCLGCFRQKKRGMKEETSIIQYISFLKYMKKVSAEKIYFTGGDLLMKWSQNKLIIEEAVHLGFKEIFIIFGGKHEIPQEIITYLSSHNIVPIFQVIVDEHGNIENSNLITFANKNSYFCILFKNHNPRLIVDSANKIQRDYNIKAMFIDRLIKLEDVKPDDYEFLRPKRQTSIADFSYSLEYNKCLNGTISLNTNCEILVCPRLKETSVGHIDKLYECLSEDNAQLYWELTKDKIEPCVNCHLRYICGDCRFLEFKLSHNLYTTINCECTVLDKLGGSNPT